MAKALGFAGIHNLVAAGVGRRQMLTYGWFLIHA